jgi:hypothetical protein
MNCGWQFEAQPAPPSGSSPGGGGLNQYVAQPGPPGPPPVGAAPPLPYYVTPPPVIPAKQRRIPSLNNRKTRIVVAAALVLLLVAGAATGAVVAISSIKHPSPAPTSEAAIRDSVAGARGYLNGAGVQLLADKDKGAPIYSATAKLDVQANTVSGTERVLYTNNTGVTLPDLVFRSAPTATAPPSPGCQRAAVRRPRRSRGRSCASLYRLRWRRERRPSSP